MSTQFNRSPCVMNLTTEPQTLGCILSNFHDIFDLRIFTSPQGFMSGFIFFHFPNFTSFLLCLPPHSTSFLSRFLLYDYCVSAVSLRCYQPVKPGLGPTFFMHLNPGQHPFQFYHENVTSSQRRTTTFNLFSHYFKCFSRLTDAQFKDCTTCLTILRILFQFTETILLSPDYA